MNDNIMFAEVIWGESGFRSNSWTVASTSVSDDAFNWQKSVVRTVHVHGDAQFRNLRGADVLDAVQVVSSVTHVEGHQLLDGSLSDFQNARDLLYHWEHNNKGRVASVYAVFYVEHNFSEMNLAAINSLLLSTSPHRLTEWSMIALLRASFSAKHMLPGWAGFFEAVKKELKNNDRAERLLFGLQE